MKQIWDAIAKDQDIEQGDTVVLAETNGDRTYAVFVKPANKTVLEFLDEYGNERKFSAINAKEINGSASIVGKSEDHLSVKRIKELSSQG